MDFRWLGQIGYEAALALQQSLVLNRLEGGAEVTDDVVLLLEHESVYTMGRSLETGSLPDDLDRLEHPVHHINRGGQSTYHGPGQLVVYPIVDLGRRGKDLHLYLRRLEEVVIALCQRAGVAGQRRAGLTGVWIEDRKVASIGVGVRRWVTMHGFALNVDVDLSPFEAITPCGIAGVEMTSLARESGRSITVGEVAGWTTEILENVLDRMPGDG